LRGGRRNAAAVTLRFSGSKTCAGLGAVWPARFYQKPSIVQILDLFDWQPVSRLDFRPIWSAASACSNNIE
jgi:hypothetical protein